MKLSAGEISNVIADTIERLYEEGGSKIDRINAEDKALHITRALRYGVDGFQTVRMTEDTLKVPLCRKHR